MCLYRKLIPNPKYKPNKKNNYSAPICKDQRALWVPVGCGKCMECRKQKSREWQTRLSEEIKCTPNGNMVTLTFSEPELNKLYTKTDQEENLKDPDNFAAAYAIRHFLENWRQQIGKPPRHWLITERGHQNTERIHIHGIIWTDQPKQIEKLWKYKTTTLLMCLYPKLIPNPKYKPNKKTTIRLQYVKINGHSGCPLAVVNVWNAANKNQENGKQDYPKK